MGVSLTLRAHALKMRLCLLLLILVSVSLNAETKKDEKGKKKSVLDLTERDVHRIYEQWEVGFDTNWHDYEGPK